MDTDGIPGEQWGTTRTCPHCGGGMLQIVWGFPDAALFEAGDRGEVFLGGCCIPPEPTPDWHCTSCGREVAVPEAATEA